MRHRKAISLALVAVLLLAGLAQVTGQAQPKVFHEAAVRTAVPCPRGTHEEVQADPITATSRPRDRLTPPGQEISREKTISPVAKSRQAPVPVTRPVATRPTGHTNYSICTVSVNPFLDTGRADCRPRSIITSRHWRDKRLGV